MPPVTRWMIRAALVWLLAGLLVDTALGLAGAIGRPSPAVAMLRIPLHHGWFFGFVVQLIFGVAWWLFPKRAGSGRGSEAVAIRAGFLLNAGLLLRVVSEPTLSQGIARPLYALAAVLQLVSVLAFVAILWPRVRGPR